MAVGDFVTMNAGLSAAPRKPLFGRVVAESAGPPAVASVQWFNGKRTDDVNQLALIKVHDATAALQELLGKWAQLVRYNPPSAAVDDDAPKSPAAAGIVHSAFGGSLYDAADPDNFFIYMSMMNGAVPAISIFIEAGDDGSSQLSTHTQRRDIG